MGRVGVLLFFAISGFVIPSSLRGLPWKGFKVFVIRRFWRLYPPFWCAVLIAWLVDPWEKTIKLIPWRMSMLPVPHWSALAIAAHFWTLQVELVFYIIVGLLFLIFGRLGLRVLFPTYLGINVVLWGWICFEWPYLMPTAYFWFGLPLYLTVMLWGACCRELIHVSTLFSGVFTVFKGRRAIGIGVVTGCLGMIPSNILFLGFWEEDAFMIYQGLTTLGGIIAFLFFAILTPVRMSWLASLGRWTYSTYLFHMAVLYFVLRVINSMMLGKHRKTGIFGRRARKA